MTIPFQMVWQDDTGAAVTELAFPISFPGTVTDPEALRLQSTAAQRLSFESMVNVAFYLTGSDVAMVQGQWPHLTDSYGQSTDLVTGGLEISFDSGMTWIRFSKTVGWAADPSTWLLMPAASVGFAGVDGQISAFDAAHIRLRYVIPPSVSITKVLDINLAVDCDIV